ncbi:MAG: hypothetical protein V3R98_01420 [Alphaproteobacteria bacterium]
MERDITVISWDSGVAPDGRRGRFIGAMLARMMQRRSAHMADTKMANPN